MRIAHPSARRAARAAARTATLLSLVGLILSTTGASLRGVPPAAAAPTAGTATIITPADGSAGASQPLTAGKGSTPFSLALPTGAACKGDSANAGYRVQSYMVPASVDPATLTFNFSGPVPAAMGTAFRQPLWNTFGTSYVNHQTADATSAGGPGPVVGIPAFDFASVYVPGNVPAGTYNIGIACTLGPASPTQLDRFWNARMEITADPTDVPAGIAWTAVPTGGGPGGGTDGGPTGGTTGGGTDGSTGGTTGGGTDGGATGGTTGGGTDGGATGGGTDGGATGGGTDGGATGGTTGGTTGGGTTGGGTTGGGGVDVLGASGGPSGTPIVGGLSSLPATGASVLSPVTWAVLLLVSGRMAVLLGRPPRVKPALR